MFTASADWYDRFSDAKDHAGESATLLALIAERRPGATTLLDVACGTGRHLEHPALHYVGATPEVLETADEEHVLGLFTAEEHIAAAEAAGLVPSWMDDGLSGRGPLVATRPA